MPLERGTRIGPHEVVAQIGAGGMGEVYRARDTRLDRDVALKVLPAAFTSDPERLARFQREAKLLASLNHPNIAGIYGLEEAGGIQALALELVEGPTLAERIAQGPLPLHEALAIARQIADALEAAHETGVIHRDLKPANIKVKPDGVVKVLDFGLAKAFNPSEASPQGAGYSDSPTLSLAATGAGVILGTGAYMAPEQARGKTVDKRADVWSFGVVLYEMLTGRRVFEGEDLSLTLASVMMKEPDWTVLPSGTPTSVRRLLRRCLEKDRRKRLADIADARLDIEEALASPTMESGVALAAAPALRPTWAQRALTAAPWILVVALVGVWLFFWLQTPPPDARQTLQFPVEFGPDIAPVSFALSPDGSSVAVLERGGDQRLRLAVRSLQDGQTRALTGTEGAQWQKFSPDGEWLAFVQESKLRKVSVQGGAPVTLCDVMNPRGLSWGADGSIVVAADRLGPLSRCPVDGGALEPLTRLEPGETSHRLPQVLPAAGAVLFTSSATGQDPDANSIVIQSVETGQRKTLWKGGTHGRYLPSGHLVFVSQNTLFAVPLDLKRMELTGSPRPIVNSVATVIGSDWGIFDVSANGLLAFATEFVGAQLSVLRLEVSGGKQPLVPGEGRFGWFRFSPVGRRGAFVLATQGVWLYDVERQARSLLAGEASPNPSANGGAWSKDGRYVFFTTRGARQDGIAAVRSDGSGAPVSLIDQRGPLNNLSISPEGTQLVFGEGQNGNSDLWILPIDLTGDAPRAAGQPKTFLNTPSDELRPAFSNDGHWIAYISTETGRPELFVRPFPGPGGKVQISGDGVRGGRFVWSRDGKELLYINFEGQLMAVAFTASGSTFTPGASRRVVDVGQQAASLEDVAPDGRSFAIIVQNDNTSNPLKLTFVVNFFDEIRRRLASSQP